MSVPLVTVSDHSGASMPMTAEDGAFFRNVAGSQSYASSTSMYAAQFWPWIVLVVYFWSRYALLAGLMISLVPAVAAAASVGSLWLVSQSSAIVDGSMGGPPCWFPPEGV